YTFACSTLSLHLYLLCLFSALSSLPHLALLFFSLMLRPPPPPTLFPYTTLFRSTPPTAGSGSRGTPRANSVGCPANTPLTMDCRSEEHTSELQSHLNLVCRLLLEKKKKRNIQK